MRAILLASATATTLNGRRARSCASQGYFSGVFLARIARATASGSSSHRRRGGGYCAFATSGSAFWLAFSEPISAGGVLGAHSVLRRAKQEKYPWLTQLLARRPFKVVAIALANKMARIAWALLARRGTYRAPRFAAA